MSAFNYFDSIFCVNLDRRTDRWAEAREELRLCGIERCERMSAVDTPHDHVGGCLASHTALWRRIATGACGQRVLILEDDFHHITRAELLRVGFTPASDVMKIFDSCPGVSAPERFAAMLPQVPTHWDLFYLGGSYEDKPHSRVAPHVIRNRGMHTTHAYGISYGFASKMIALFDTHGSGAAIDSHLASQAKDADVFSYTLTPRLFIQRPTSVSDINPQPPGFPWSQTDSRHEMMV